MDKIKKFISTSIAIMASFMAFNMYGSGEGTAWVIALSGWTIVCLSEWGL